MMMYDDWRRRRAQELKSVRIRQDSEKASNSCPKSSAPNMRLIANLPRAVFVILCFPLPRNVKLPFTIIILIFSHIHTNLLTHSYLLRNPSAESTRSRLNRTEWTLKSSRPKQVKTLDILELRRETMLVLEN